MKPRSNSHALRRSYFRHLIPAGIWLLAVAVVVWLLGQRAQRFEILGVAQGPVRNVATNVAGRLTHVPVQLFDPVRRGQVVAVVNTVLDSEYVENELNARLATITAEIAHLMAQLVPAEEEIELSQSERETARIADLRRFDVDVEDARLQILRLQAELANDRMELKRLATEKEVTKQLVEKGAVVPYEVEKLQTQQEVLAQRIEENERLLEQARADLEEAKRRRQEYAGREPVQPSVRDRLEVIRRAIAVQERQMEEVKAQLSALKQREALELVSPLDGIVSRVWRGAGEAVTAGDPIVTISEVRPQEVLGYAARGQIGQVQEDMPVDLIKTSEPLQIARTEVVYVGPVVEQMPPELWQNPNVPQWGRPFRVEVPEGFEVIPGEVVGIRGL